MSEAQAISNARYQLSGSTYAQNAIGAPAIIAATDQAESVSQAASMANGSDYTYNNVAANGYVPTISSVQNDGNVVLNGQTYTGFTSPWAMAQQATQGLPSSVALSNANIAAVGGVQQSLTTQDMKNQQAMALEQLKQQGALTVQQERSAAASAEAQRKELAKANPGGAVPVITIK